MLKKLIGKIRTNKCYQNSPQPRKSVAVVAATQIEERMLRDCLYQNTEVALALDLREWGLMHVDSVNLGDHYGYSQIFRYSEWKINGDIVVFWAPTSTDQVVSYTKMKEYLHQIYTPIIWTTAQNFPKVLDLISVRKTDLKHR